MAPIAKGDKDFPHTPGRLWLMTRLAFVLFVLAVAGLLWLSHRADMEERRATLISDMLWLEQNLHFVMGRNEELLERLGIERGDSRARFFDGARSLLDNGSGLRQVFWFDPKGSEVFSVPNASRAHIAGEDADASPSRSTFGIAASIGRPSYSQTYPVLPDDWQFEIHVPVFENQQLKGMIVGVYSLRRMIEEAVPWWLAERYRIAVIHLDGRELASRSKIAPTQQQSDYQLSFDPPGHGLTLRAVPYRPEPALAGRILAATVILLAMAVLWSLWALRQHVQRRQETELALRKEYAFRKAMEDSLHTGMRARDLTGRITYVNPAFCRMVGWDAEELVGRLPPMPYWLDDEIDQTRQLHDQILAGDGPDRGFELRLKRRNGEIFTALIHEAPLIDQDGNRTGWMGAVVDITENKLAEERIRLQQERLQATSRLIAIGEMASGIAHELNQPLAAISSYCTAGINLIRQHKPAETVLPLLEKAATQSRRAGEIIRRIYRGARRGEGHREALSLDECLTSAVSLVEHVLQRQGVRLDLRYQSKPRVAGDPVLLEQAIVNLLRNGAEAMQCQPPAERVLTVTIDQRNGMAMLSIADRGGGIPENAHERLFEPLFTTKPEGLGMGLAICRSVVESHRGRLWFDSPPEGGTTFHLTIPVTK